jgi:hypothetical protein
LLSARGQRTPITVVHLQQFVELWSIVHAAVLRQGTEDKITLRLTESGEYSSRSAYRAQFIRSTTINLRQLIWKPWIHQNAIFFCLAPLGICPRGNHRDDDIATVSMIYYVFIEYPLKTNYIDWQLCELFMKLFYLYDYSKVVLDRSLCEDTHEY